MTRITRKTDVVGELHLIHSAWLKRQVSARYAAEEADDLVQETFLRMSQYAPDDIRHPKAFLLRIASNLARDWAARTERRRATEALLFDWKVSGLIGDAEQTLTLKQIILGLPEPLRDVFVMSRVGGLSNAQIAERLGISPKTVEWRMTKALAHCAAQLR